jgi:hypothetical protein
VDVGDNVQAIFGPRAESLEDDINEALSRRDAVVTSSMATTGADPVSGG